MSSAADESDLGSAPAPSPEGVVAVLVANNGNTAALSEKRIGWPLLALFIILASACTLVIVAVTAWYVNQRRNKTQINNSSQSETASTPSLATTNTYIPSPRKQEKRFRRGQVLRCFMIVYIVSFPPLQFLNTKSLLVRTLSSCQHSREVHTPVCECQPSDSSRLHTSVHWSLHQWWRPSSTIREYVQKRVSIDRADSAPALMRATKSGRGLTDAALLMQWQKSHPLALMPGREAKHAHTRSLVCPQVTQFHLCFYNECMSSSGITKSSDVFRVQALLCLGCPRCRGSLLCLFQF